MRILLIQENGKHEENRAYRECNCLSRALGVIGHDAICWGPGHADAKISDMVEWSQAIVVMEQYDESGWVPVIPSGRRPVVYWAIDSHCALEHERRLASHVNANIILCAVLPDVPKFRDIAKEVMWWPNAFPTDLIDSRGFTAGKKHDVGFCGTPGPLARQKAIDTMRCVCHMKHDNMVLGDFMVDAVAGYRIGWNWNIGDDINYRTFETMGIGTMLLTNATPGLNRLFNAGKHLVTYTNTDDAVNKVRYYLAHDHERVAIAEEGCGVAALFHGYDSRAAQLVAVIESKGDEKPYGSA